MKTIRFFLLAGIFFLLTGCGGEVTVTATVPLPDPVIYPPSITALQFHKDAVQKFIVGTIDFTAPDTDLDTMTVIVSDGAGREVSRTITDLRSFAGYTAGTIFFSIDYITLFPGGYTFTIYLTDWRGFLSNPVYGTFAVP